MEEHLKRTHQWVGDYKLLRSLGKGSFADVYLAEQRHDHTRVAIKLLRTRLTSKEEVRSFIKEASMARLQHPHIVPLLHFGISQNDIPFLVLKFIPYGTLRDQHPKGSQVPLHLVQSYVAQVASALQYAHDRHLVHRDVKPENILLGEEYNVLLSDFGIATTDHGADSLISSSLIKGTPLYMAPEQFHRKAQVASDQYSLAVVAYEWLTGKRLFNGSPFEIAMQHEKEPPVPLLKHVPTLPGPVEHVVLKALAKNPADRFATVQDFAHALEQADQLTQIVLHQEILLPDTPEQKDDITTVPTDPTIPDEKTTKPISRRTVAIRLGIVSLTLLASGLTFLAYTQRENPPPQATPTPLPLGQVIATYTAQQQTINAVSWSPDGKRIASASNDQTVHIWEAYTGKQISTYGRHTNIVEAVAWSPDGSLIASAGFDNTVHVWDAQTTQLLYTYPGHTEKVVTVTWSSDSKRIASGSYDTTVHVWDALTGANTFIYTGHNSLVYAVAWSSGDTRIASSSNDNTVHVWDAANGNHPFTYSRHNNPVNAVSWLPGGKRIASGGNDSTVQIWNDITGGNAVFCRGHSDIVGTVACSPDGKRIASGSSDNTVRLWDAASGKLLYTYEGHSEEVKTVAWSLPDGRLIASGSMDMAVHIWGAG